MRKVKFYGSLLTIICVLIFLNCNGHDGFQGVVFEKDGNLKISGARLKFLREDGSYVKYAVSDANGQYKIALNPDRYYVTATHPDYEDYTTIPGFFVVTGDGYQTGNFFLSRPRVTTVLLVRHADRGNDHLNDEGHARARKLAKVAFKAGVTRIFSTPTNRTQQTVQYLADTLKLDVKIEGSVENLVDTINTHHSGDVVLVASHSGIFDDPNDNNSVPKIIRAIGGASCDGYVQEYDNLYVVNKDAENQSPPNVLNLQYGESSEYGTPDHITCPYNMTTILLLRYAESGNAGTLRGQKLAHVLHKSRIAAIYATETNREPVSSLATEFNITASTYNPNDISGFLNGLISAHTNEAVVVAGEKNHLSEIIQTLNASPMPPLYPDELDNLFLITIGDFYNPKIVNLQFGAPSP